MQNIVTPDFSQSEGIRAPASPKTMLTVQRDGSQTTVRVNSSSLGLLQTCGRKSYYTLVQRWKPQSGSPPLVFGSAAHKALDVFYAHTCRERSMPMNFMENAEAMAHGAPAPEAHFLYDAIAAFLREAAPLNVLPATDKRSLVSGTWMLGHYFSTYLNDVYVIHSDEQGPLTERTCEHVIYEDAKLRVILFGTIDLILRNEVTQEILPGDHKTSSQMGADFLNRIKPNHQYTGYMWLAQKCLGITSENFLVNGLQVKARPLTSRGGPPTFTRQITRRTAQDFAEFQDSLLWAVRSYLAWEESGVWPMGTVDACATWGGCPYLEVCGAPNELRENILANKFTQENA